MLPASPPYHCLPHPPLLPPAPTPAARHYHLQFSAIAPRHQPLPPLTLLPSPASSSPTCCHLCSSTVPSLPLSLSSSAARTAQSLPPPPLPTDCSAAPSSTTALLQLPPLQLPLSRCHTSLVAPNHALFCAAAAQRHRL
ncbi:hypothetical protein GW17_00004489 [Ensete ventricosum]|nr:hypothetical protein GW17_00004489 [Ensete ventricosum]